MIVIISNKTIYIDVKLRYINLLKSDKYHKKLIIEYRGKRIINEDAGIYHFYNPSTNRYVVVTCKLTATYNTNKTILVLEDVKMFNKKITEMIKLKHKKPVLSKFWIIVLLTMLMLLVAALSKAATKVDVRTDTILCKQECIIKYVSTETKSGKQKTYVIYKDEKNNIEELIPVSNSVLEYINLCKQNGIKPHLGIRLKNNQITSIIKHKPKIK